MSAYQAPGVYIKELDLGPRPIAGVGTSVAAFVGFSEKVPLEEPDEPKYISSWTQFKNTFGGISQHTYLGHAVNGYFANGGGACFVVRVPVVVTEALSVTLNSHKEGKPTLKVTGKEPSVAFKVAVGLPDDTSSASDEADLETKPQENTFNLRVRVGKEEERFENLTFGKGPSNVIIKVNDESKFIEVKDLGHSGVLADRIPAAGEFATEAPDFSEEIIKAKKNLKGLFIGSAADYKGLNGLEAVDEVSTVCMPDLMKAFELKALSSDDVVAVQKEMLAHCDNMDYRFAILDPLPGKTPTEVKKWKEDSGFADKFGALYYPWIRVSNPAGSGYIRVPPSGFVAGIYARSDFNRGVHKAPANELINLTLGPDRQLTRAEVELLNPEGINCIRAFPARGTRVWGARTLASPGDTLWQYINVRRLFNYVEQSIEQGTQWVVFEPNDLELWGRVRRDVTSFLTRLWRDGALFGATPEEAFFVKCDEEINTEEVRSQGQLIIQVGLAPVKPAEFVIFEISQKTKDG